MWYKIFAKNLQYISGQKKKIHKFWQKTKTVYKTRSTANLDSSIQPLKCVRKIGIYFSIAKLCVQTHTHTPAPPPTLCNVVFIRQSGHGRPIGSYEIQEQRAWKRRLCLCCVTFREPGTIIMSTSRLGGTETSKRFKKTKQSQTGLTSLIVTKLTTGLKNYLFLGCITVFHTIILKLEEAVLKVILRRKLKLPNKLYIHPLEKNLFTINQTAQKW